jgi:hypothetical protein
VTVPSKDKAEFPRGALEHIMAHSDDGDRYDLGDPMPRSRSGADPYQTAELPEVAPGSADGGTVTTQLREDEAPAPPELPPAGDRGGGALRGLFWLIGIIGVILAVLWGLHTVNLWPHLSNPFVGKKTDRSQPVLLKSIQDLNRFVAAEGNFQVIVDMQNNRKYIPDFLVNDRVLFVAAGSVESYVDFSAIGQGAITESGDHRTVTIKLPAPQLGKPNIDHDKSYVFAEQRGLVNRLGELVGGDPNRQQQLYQLAEQKITEAAKETALTSRAEENTRKMLEEMLQSLGYTTVTITFANP